MVRYLDLKPIREIPLNWEPLFDAGFAERETARPIPGRSWPSLNLLIVAARLLAYLSAPEDPRLRDDFAKHTREALEFNIDRTVSEPDICAQAHKRWGDAARSVRHIIEGTLREDIRRLTPYETKEAAEGAHALGVIEVDRLMRAGLTTSRTTGMVLSLLRSLDYYHKGDIRGASLNKAAHVLETTLGISRSETMKAWSATNSVAHLAAAYADFFYMFDAHFDSSHPSWAAELGPLGDFTPCVQMLGPFLSLALSYQTFGLAFHPSGSKRPLLDPERLWRIPQRLALPKLHEHPMPIASEFFEAAKRYRAPKAIY